MFAAEAVPQDTEAVADAALKALVIGVFVRGLS